MVPQYKTQIKVLKDKAGAFESAEMMLPHMARFTKDKLKDDEKIAFENLSNSAFSKMFNDEFSEVGLNYEDMQEEIQKKIEDYFGAH